MTIISDQKTGVTPEIDRRTALIASLRILADLFEDIPQLPLMSTSELFWNVLGRDAEALQILEDVQTALTAEGVKYEVTDDTSFGVNIPLIGGYKARLIHVYDRTMNAFYARASYDRVVQVDAEQAEAVSA